jgi:hypothetical protein
MLLFSSERSERNHAPANTSNSRRKHTFAGWLLTIEVNGVAILGWGCAARTHRHDRYFTVLGGIMCFLIRGGYYLVERRAEPWDQDERDIRNRY